MKRDLARGSRARVERFLAEDRSERLPAMRDLQRRVPDHGRGRRRTKMFAGGPAAFDNLVPILHLWRMRRSVPALLDALQHLCWETGFQTGCEVDPGRDFELVLYRWAHKRPFDSEFGGAAPARDELAAAVAARLRASRSWKLALGFVPVVGPIAAYRIDATLGLSFRELARQYFRSLRAAGVRPLPGDFVIPRPKRSKRDRRDRHESTRRSVERFLAEHRSEEELRNVREMPKLYRSARVARMLGGAPGMAGNLIPGRHLQFLDLEKEMFLSMLQAICWQVGVKAGSGEEQEDDFERILLRWAGDSEDDFSREAVITAASRRLHAASLWKLTFGFLPLIGPLMGFIIDGSMAAHCYRTAQRFYEERVSALQIAAGG